MTWIKKLAAKHPAGMASTALHLLILIFIIGGIPSLFKDDPKPIQIVSIDMLPISEITNVKPQIEEQPEIKVEKPKPKSPVKKVYSKPKPPPKAKPKPPPKAKPKPAPKKVEKKAEKKPEKKVEKKAEKPKVEKKPEPKKDEFESVLRSVEEMEVEAQKKKQQQIASYDPTQALSVSEKDAIRQRIRRQVEDKWQLMPGARDAENMVIELKISLLQDGTVENVRVVDSWRYNNDLNFKVNAERAVNAVRAVERFEDLPAKYYTEWSEVTLHFNPGNVI